ncbi:MAG: YlxR family protein [Clostridiales bacterium]|nr:YlxR family protein [Clostridiales bacterium]
MKKKPQRMCVSCKTRADKKDLLRVVLLQSGDIAYDPSGKLPGRGSYLCKKEECIMAELKANRLAKGLRHKVEPEELKKIADTILKECEAEE